MNRTIFSQLEKWKNSSNRKPLILRGARQVGKTWTMKEFGKRYFKNIAYVNFDNNTSLKSIFESDINIPRIILALSAADILAVAFVVTLYSSKVEIS